MSRLDARLLGLSACIAGFCTAMAFCLVMFKVEQVQRQAVHGRFDLMAREVAQVAERSLEIGLPLSGLHALPAVLARHSRADRRILSIDVTDRQGVLLYSSAASRAGEGREAVARRTVENSFSVPQGYVAVRYDAGAGGGQQALGRGLVALSLAVFALAAALLFLLLKLRAARPDRTPGAAWTVLAPLLAVCALAMAAIACFAYGLANQALTGELREKAAVVAFSLASTFGQAAHLGLDVAQMPGIQDRLDEVRAQHPGLSSIEVKFAGGGRYVAQAADSAAINAALTAHASFGDAQEAAGLLTVSVDERYVAGLFMELGLDFLVLLVVVAFLTLELAYCLAGRLGDAFARPAAADAALGGMRAPFLLLLLAEDLSRGFLPLYAAALPAASWEIPAQWVVGAPIALFMLAVAFSQPTLGPWAARVGARRAFFWAAAVGAATHLLSAQAGNVAQLLAWRCAAGVAWAVAFVAIQAQVLEATAPAHRARGLAAFAGVIMVSMICGPPVGGLLADGLGQQATLLVAAALAGCAGLAALAAPRAVAGRVAAGPAAPAGLRRALLGNPRFMGLVVLAAMPAKLVLVGYCFYLIPLFISAAGHTAAMSGRLIMVYSVVMVLGMPLALNQLERLQRSRSASLHPAFVAAGLVLSGLAGFCMVLPHDLLAAALVVTVLGAAQALSIAPQAALVQQVAPREIALYGQNTVYGYYRFGERVGNALGPLACAALLAWTSARMAFMWLGALTALSGLVFAWLYVPARAPAVAR